MDWRILCTFTYIYECSNYCAIKRSFGPYSATWRYVAGIPISMNLLKEIERFVRDQVPVNMTADGDRHSRLEYSNRPSDAGHCIATTHRHSQFSELQNGILFFDIHHHYRCLNSVLLFAKYYNIKYVHVIILSCTIKTRRLNARNHCAYLRVWNFVIPICVFYIFDSQIVNKFQSHFYRLRDSFVISEIRDFKLF